MTCSVSEVNCIDQLMARSTNPPLLWGQNCRYAWNSTLNSPLTSSRDSSDARLCRDSGGRRGIRDYCCHVSGLSHAHWKSWVWCDNLGLTPCAGLKRGNGNCPSGKIEVALQNNEYRCKHGTADQSLSLRQGQWKKGQGCAKRLGRTKRVLTRVTNSMSRLVLPPLNFGDTRRQRWSSAINQCLALLLCKMHGFGAVVVSVRLMQIRLVPAILLQRSGTPLLVGADDTLRSPHKSCYLKTSPVI